jgi:hypothetical protein
MIVDFRFWILDCKGGERKILSSEQRTMNVNRRLSATVRQQSRGGGGGN